MITVVILPGMDGTGIEVTDFVAALAPELEAIVVTYPNDRPMQTWKARTCSFKPRRPLRRGS